MITALTPGVISKLLMTTSEIELRLLRYAAAASYHLDPKEQ